MAESIRSASDRTDAIYHFWMARTALLYGQVYRWAPADIGVTTANRGSCPPRQDRALEAEMSL